jgi:hypothetical protein
MSEVRLWLRVMSGLVVDCALWRTADGAACLVIEKCTGGGLAVFLRGVEEGVTRFYGEVGVGEGLLGGSACRCCGIEVLHEGFANGA